MSFSAREISGFTLFCSQNIKIVHQWPGLSAEKGKGKRHGKFGDQDCAGKGSFPEKPYDNHGI